MRASPLLLSLSVILALSSSVQSAALVRFVNTVATRNSAASFTQFENTPTAQAAAEPQSISYLRVRGEAALSKAAGTIVNRVSLNQDRIGLQYFADASNGVSTPILVQTQIIEAVTSTLAAGAVTAAQVVGDVYTTIGSAPYGWYHALPALRGYHKIVGTSLTPTTAQTTLVDRPFGSSDNTFTASGHLLDYYEWTQLRADGVMGYLSFAPGTYSFQGYSVMCSSDAAADYTATPATNTKLPSNNAMYPLTSTKTSFTFGDNKVYTIIAIGDGDYNNAVTPRSAHTVKLVLLEESVAPTTFGMSAIRFVHTLTSSASQPLDVYAGAGLTTKIASNIPYGGVSDYIDVAPAVTQEFPLAYGSPSTVVANGVGVQREIRAGSRVTVICANNAVDKPAIFCRGIPSRVVAYVRLIADTNQITSVVQGKAGPQRLSSTPLSLWAAYEYPRPEVVAEQSQVVGTTSASGSAVQLEGLYPVVVNVAAGSASGYGEVHVPLHIIDYAIRPVLSQSAPAVGPAAPTAITADFVTVTKTTGYWFAPIYKRANFVVKTDGFATLSGRNTARRNALPLPAVGGATVLTNIARDGIPTAFGADSKGTPEFAGLQNAISIDKSVEPGQFYSFVVSGNYYAVQTSVDNGEAALTTTNINIGSADLTTPITAWQDAAIVRFAFNTDRTAAAVAAATSTASVGAVVFYPLAVPQVYGLVSGAAAATAAVAGAYTGLVQSFANSQIHVAKKNDGAVAAQGSANTITVTPKAGGNSITTFTHATPTPAIAGVGAGGIAASAAQIESAENAIAAGTYSLQFKLNLPATIANDKNAAATTEAPTDAGTASAKCFNSLVSGDFTVTAGAVTDIFALGSYACFTPGTVASVAVNTAAAVGYAAPGTADTTKLSFLAVTRNSAVVSGHSPFSTTAKKSVESAVEVPLYAAASSVSVYVAAIIALLGSLLALAL